MADKKHPDNSTHPVNPIIQWFVPEYDKYERTKFWYIAASIFAILAIVYALWATNFLFVVIVVLSGIIIVLNDGGAPQLVSFAIFDEGIMIGNKFIDYDELKSFSIIYKPRQKIKKLYFEFHNIFRPRLSIHLNDTNPLKIRDILLNYLQEDLNRETEPFSERMGKLFKI